MIEQLEFDASRFWKHFDAKCRSVFRASATPAYERMTLLILFLWTERAVPLPNQLHLGDEVVKWWSQSVRRLNEVLTLEPEERIDDRVVDTEFLVSALYVLSNFDEISPRTAAYFFDYRFIRLAERETGTHRLLSHYSASLANALNDPDNAFVDVYCTTGELFFTSGNERWRRHGLHGPHGYLFQIGAFGLEVRLRLALHERAPQALQRLTLQERDTWASPYVHLPSRFGPHTLVRIDPPARKAMPSLRDTHIRGASNPSLMFDYLRGMFGIQLALIVVAGSERTSIRRALLEVRQRLLEEGRLTAVIDLPSTPGARVEKSAWLVSPRSTRIQQGVLMINTAELGDFSTHQEYGGLAEFSGRIVRLLVSDHVSSRWATSSREDSAAHLRHLFEREFEGGYRDVPGLCRLVSEEEIRHKDYALLASRYLPPATRSAWLSGIDGAPLLGRLFSETNGGQTIYLIGNNGEGKSLLLREIAQASSERQRKTIGISCSASDRFPMPSNAAPGFENFIYEGSRTSNTSANLKRLATDACRKFVLIHQSAEHLSVFDEVLRLIEFATRRYLMPLKVSSNVTQTKSDWLMANTVELVSNATINQERTKSLDAGSMQIALMRFESKGGITPFLNLSSGEQQIVSLVLKIIAHAERGCLFLIDEPEISLHVSWQRVLPRVLATIARYFFCDILVATHSPLLISSVSDDSGVCYVTSMQRLTPIDSRDRRSVESVLFKGFHTHTANNRFIHERCATIVAAAIGIMNTENPDRARLQYLINELGDMRRTVLAASDKLDRAGIKLSLEVIKTAREALNKLTSDQAGSDAEEELD